MTAFSGALALEDAVIARCVILFTGEDVTVGREMPASDSLDDIVWLGTSSSTMQPATISRTLRTFEETIEVEVNFSAFRGGGAEQSTVVRTRAATMLGRLADYCRVTDPTLGGVVRDCFLTAYVTAPATDQSVLSLGRMQVLTATFTAHFRVTS